MAEEPEEGQGQVLTDNLGTEDIIRFKGKIDNLKFSNIEGDERDWLIFCELGAALGNKALVIAENVYLRSSVGIGGLGMRYAIRGEQVRKGIASNVDQEIRRPNILSRTFTPGGREQEREYQAWKREKELEQTLG
jgi:hypothetical protein